MALALSCSAATGAVSFTGYRPDAALPTDSSGYVDVTCTCTLDCLVLAYTIEVQAGPSSPVASRKMKRVGGSETLKYSLYRDPTRLLAFDVGLNAQAGAMALGQFGQPQRTYVYGRVTAGQVVPSGSYSDAPVVSVAY